MPFLVQTTSILHDFHHKLLGAAGSLDDVVNLIFNNFVEIYMFGGDYDISKQLKYYSMLRRAVIYMHKYGCRSFDRFDYSSDSFEEDDIDLSILENDFPASISINYANIFGLDTYDNVIITNLDHEDVPLTATSVSDVPAPRFYLDHEDIRLIKSYDAFRRFLRFYGSTRFSDNCTMADTVWSWCVKYDEIEDSKDILDALRDADQLPRNHHIFGDDSVLNGNGGNLETLTYLTSLGVESDLTQCHCEDGETGDGRCDYCLLQENIKLFQTPRYINDLDGPIEDLLAEVYEDLAGCGIIVPV